MSTPRSAPAYRITPNGRASGQVVAQLRRDRGLSPEALSSALLLAGHGPVSGKTIRRIEQGVTPRLRVQHAVSAYFNRSVTQVWP